MAALCTGSYGLSQNCTDDSKQYFFVKLTDSAYRAIEDYERNQNKYNTQAKIQISENGGVISFPTTKENAGQQFTFAIDEIEGSLECIQQKKTQLDVLGTLQYKMRIHANDDVYETTRHRMAVAEETQKKKSTVEIKPNQTDIGRRVKLKNLNSRFSNISSKRDLVNPTSATTFQSSITSPNSLLVNGIGSTISSLSPSTVATNYQHHNNDVPSYSGAANLGTSIGHTTEHNSISLNNTNSSSIGLLSTQNSKTNLSNNTVHNLPNSSTKYLQFNNNNSNNTNNRSSTGNGRNIGLPTAASSLSSALSSAAGSGTSGITGSYFNSTNNSANIRTTAGLNTGNSSINGAGSRKNNTTTVGNSKNNSRHNISDIKKRAIRERLIHMLALKNFKKPEIYARLQNEGIRDKEKNLVSTLLKDISILRDNTFNLKHQIWNEVNEDWPFYTEQEVQILKRRKPQNLTPPLSSDGGSSTSGQSPTSTHNGSPPPAVKRPSIDRGSYYEEPTGKKQRISHFKKDINDFNSSNNSRLHQDTDVNLMGLSYSVLGTEAARRISPRDVTLVNGQNVLCQQQINTNHQNAVGKTNSVNYKNNNAFISTNTNNCGNNRLKSPSNQNHNISISNISSNSSLYNSNNINNNNNNIKNNNHNTNNNINEINICNKGKTKSGDSQQPETSFTKNDIRSSAPTDSVQSVNCGNRSSSSSSWMSFERGASRNNDISVEDSAEETRSNSEDIPVSDSNHTFDFSRFKKITTLEQRRKYKTEFGNDYDEYKKLLNEIDSVRTRFNILAQQLHNARNNDANYRSIKRQIIEEYQRIQNQREHQNVKARFNYLHGKLAHIKKLVNEFDKTLTSDSTAQLSDPSELSENTNYRNRSPVSSSAQNYDSGNYDTSGSRSDLNCDNSDFRSGNSNDSIRVTNCNYTGKINTITSAGSSSSPNSTHKTSGTPPSSSFLGATTTYHLSKNENY